ncbi:GntR family transcriptional regulator [Ramlibacter tataouinensis]|uniref:Transcriptional regulator, GntR family-like protein n=1 Tax=Ramlibacter tataouinensis (strain ATCC BAA-407 / DSM 14655 / LMG 21543 / TTB310) TaxID=365046 RepID=F5XWJ1_RAMTT|nr:GntR family transcriptional regulator [Ramlibacter tataouinensis]AEG92945.1 transcriptional regulator, GntR family-like protein [Ramlibacter tataouinensis TTB310]
MTAALPLPKYHQIYLVLREQLQEGRFAQGLPGELELMRQFGVARVTVRRALQELAGEGLIARERGRGTRALSAAHGASPAARAGAAGAKTTRLTGLLENLVSTSLNTTVRVLEVGEVAAATEVAQALRLQPGEPVQKAVRVRSTREGPLSHITTWVPAALAQGFGKRELARKPILVLLEEAGVRVGGAHQTLSARLADAQVAAQLGLAVGSALLAVRRLIHDEDGRPVQWLHGLYRPDRYEYQMQLSRVGEIDAKVWVSRDFAAQFH